MTSPQLMRYIGATPPHGERGRRQRQAQSDHFGPTLHHTTAHVDVKLHSRNERKKKEENGGGRTHSQPFARVGEALRERRVKRSASDKHERCIARPIQTQCRRRAIEHVAAHK